MNDQFTKELHDARSDARDCRNDALARLCPPVEVEQPRFTFRYIRSEPVPPAECGVVVGVVWRDTWTGMEQAFAAHDFVGAARWKRKQVEKTSTRAA